MMFLIANSRIEEKLTFKQITYIWHERQITLTVSFPLQTAGSAFSFYPLQGLDLIIEFGNLLLKILTLWYYRVLRASFISFTLYKKEALDN